MSAPAELLRDVHIVDTPGTNAIIREHERLTTEFVPRADLVLFVTSADRPFTETERAFLAVDSRLGQEDRHHRQQGGHLRAPRGARRGAATFVADACARAARHHARDLSGQRAAGAAAKHGEPALWGDSRLRAARAVHPRRRSMRAAASG